MLEQKFSKLREAHAKSIFSAKDFSEERAGLDFNDGFSLPEFFSSKTALFYASYKIVIDTQNIDQIEESYNEAIQRGESERCGPIIDFLIDMLTFRIENYSLQQKSKIISLGEDCLPRTITTRWGFKPPRVLGELTCPFDLSVHPTKSAAELLENDFADYMLRENVIFDSSKGHPVNTHYGILWNHETGADWTNNSNEKLLALYERRIGNFYKMLKSDSPIVFLYISKSVELETIYRIIRKIGSNSDGKAKLAILTSFPEIEFPEGEFYIDNILVFHKHEPLPYEWYMWWFHEHFTLPLGHAWERRVVNWFQKILAV